MRKSNRKGHGMLPCSFVELLWLVLACLPFIEPLRAWWKR